MSSGAGRDPKPFPPPMKLCKEMVDAMGGQDSEHYRQFKVRPPIAPVGVSGVGGWAGRQDSEHYRQFKVRRTLPEWSAGARALGRCLPAAGGRRDACPAGLHHFS